LAAAETIAMVGASSNWNRPSYFVMKYLQGKGYRVIPVNPGHRRQGPARRDGLRLAARHPRQDRHGRHVPRLRRGARIVDDAIAIGAKVVWMQLGVRNDAAAAKGEAAGLKSS
jgi:O-acetylhomoserine (thiol)-lyase